MFRKAINRWNKYQSEVSTIRELNRLTNRELNDIGISRNDILSVAKGTKFDL